MNKLFCILLIGIIITSCNPSVNENPLQVLKKGLWVPVLENPFSYKITRKYMGASDSTFMYTIPCWIIGTDKQKITERTALNYCSDHKLIPNEDGKWEIEHYDCVIKTNDKKDQLICSYKDVNGEMHEIKYRNCLEESSLSLDQFWMMEDQLKNTVWQETLGDEKQKYYVFTADTGINNKPNSHQKIYKYPIVLDSMNQQLSEDRSEFKNVEFLFKKNLIFLYLESQNSKVYVLDKFEGENLKFLKLGQEDVPVLWTKERIHPPAIDTLINRFNSVKLFK